MAGSTEKDAISGQHTTGHEWDGIKELNTPLPKWWVYVFFITIIWAIGYWIAYPAIPLGDSYTPGLLGYHARKALDAELVAAHEAQKDKLDQIAKLSVDDLSKDKALSSWAMRGGEVLFKDNCAPCHQTGGAGASGFPNLADDIWLWGGKLDDIQTTITHGIRSDKDEATHTSEMPAFGRDKILTPEQISQVADYVVSMSSTPIDGPGKDIYVQNCAACHSSDGAKPISDGNQQVGAPPLSAGISLYAKKLTKDLVVMQATNPRHGVMPAWGGRLKDTDIKELTLYVHSLGGGQ